MPPARAIFMGSPAFAVPSLTALCERPDLAHVVAVVTQPDKPVGRGQNLMPPAVKVAAEARGIPVLQPKSLKDETTQGALRALAPDLMVVAAYGKILPPAVLDLPRCAAVNVHASLLPRHRGASPIAHALLCGDHETGVSIMRMEVGLDTGPVYRRDTLPIDGSDTCGTLTLKLALLGAQALVAALPGILSGTLIPEPQDHARATYAPLLDKEDGRLDFARPAEELGLRVRALDPWPGAFTTSRGKRVLVWKAHPREDHGRPGVVLVAGSEGVVVACGQGALALDEVQPEGKRRMAAAQWVQGRGVATGEQLGD